VLLLDVKEIDRLSTGPCDRCVSRAVPVRTGPKKNAQALLTWAAALPVSGTIANSPIGRPSLTSLMSFLRMSTSKTPRGLASAGRDAEVLPKRQKTLDSQAAR
jgi:hypothetical protein